MRVALAIVGNGGAAAEAVLALRAAGHRGEIHLFSENSRPPYNPMLGTYLISGAIALAQAFPFGDAGGFYENNRVTTHLGQPVAELDAAAQTLTVADGTSFEYDRCLVATGARPTLPPVAGLREAAAAGREAARRRVFTLRSLDDALSLKEALRLVRTGAVGPTRAPRVALIGASFVGLKLAAVLRDMGIGVCLVEREPQILPRSAHPECARLMETHLLKQGHELRLAASVESVEAGPRGVRLTITDSGDRAGETCRLPGAPPPAIPAEAAPAGPEDFDLAVVCTGIRPALDFLVPDRVATGQGIIVDERMRSSVPSLYAAGDVAEGMNLLSGRHEMIALWASARYQGRAAGRSLAGAHGCYRGSVPSSISHVGHLLFASVGELEGCDRVTIDGDDTAMRLQTWRGQSLVGVNLLGRCHSAGALKQTLQKAAMGVAAAREATWTSFNG